MTAKKKTAAKPVDEVIVSYKGFDADWKCRGFQYEVGKSYEHEGTVRACDSGFHACEYPLHVLRYYGPAQSVYAVVEQGGTLSRHADDSKVASSKLTVTAQIDLAGLVKAAIKYTMDRCTVADGATSNKPNAAVGASGDSGAATASGDSGAATASGPYGAATASGHSGAATASGHSGAATASGPYGAATASGNKSAACASGRHGKARGTIGSVLFLVHRDDDLNITHARALIVGKDGIKPDVFYTLGDDGVPVEAA